MGYKALRRDKTCREDNEVVVGHSPTPGATTGGLIMSFTMDCPKESP